MPRPKPQRAPTAAPLRSPKIWADGTALYLELHDKTVVSFARTAAGLGRALHLIAGQPYDFGGTVQARSVPEPAATLADAHAEAVCRRLGLIR